MNTTKRDLTIIGRAEKMDLLDLNITQLPAKIDTGADVSSIWAHKIEEIDGELHVVFLGPESPFYTGEEVVYDAKSFTKTRVANSFGQREIRYKIKLSIRINGRIIRATFSLANRSNKLYPVLIGRSLLTKKFLVDVSKGDPLLKEEQERKKRLHKELSDAEGDI